MFNEIDTENQAFLDAESQARLDAEHADWFENPHCFDEEDTIASIGPGDFAQQMQGLFLRISAPTKPISQNYTCNPLPVTTTTFDNEVKFYSIKRIRIFPELFIDDSVVIILDLMSWERLILRTGTHGDGLELKLWGRDTEDFKYPERDYPLLHTREFSLARYIDNHRVDVIRAREYIRRKLIKHFSAV